MISYHYLVVVVDLVDIDLSILSLLMAIYLFFNLYVYKFINFLIKKVKNDDEKNFKISFC